MLPRLWRSRFLPAAPDPGAGNPEKPNIGLGGYIIEPSWDTSDNAEHKLVPGGSLYKDPYVGIGKGSEDAVIYVYIDNPFKNNSVYFTLNEGWEAVSEYSQAGTESDTYVGGLFKYTAVLTASDSADSWTAKPVFTKINVSDDATNDDFDVEEKSIEVSCFIHSIRSGLERCRGGGLGVEIQRNGFSASGTNYEL